MKARSRAQARSSALLEKLRRGARSIAARIALTLLTAPFAAVPHSWVQALGRGITRVIWRPSRRYRRACKHLRTVTKAKWDKPG